VSRETIERFYSAFDAGDGDAMAACYAPDARFSDPAFGELRGDQVGAMWRMLTGRAQDLRVELREHDDTSARWVARYTFGRTGRKVTNDVRATFVFRDGLIAEHDDRFSFHRWARQALGPAGLLLGWTPVLRSKVRAQARADLERFMDSTAGG
jgi:ketosteroid isomerase-like protein